MADRVVIVKAGNHLVSLPFEHIDEILGADRIESLEDLPENASREDPGEESWVFSRGSYLPVNVLLPGTSLTTESQIVVVRWGDTGRAFAVDQVMGIEATGQMSAFPKMAGAYTDVPIAGVHFWKNGPVLELDLSRLIPLNAGS